MSMDLPEPQPLMDDDAVGSAGRGTRATWAVAAVCLLVVGVLALGSFGDDGDPDLEIGLPLPRQTLLGGQSSVLGSDPDSGDDDNVWLNVAGPEAITGYGDRFHAALVSTAGSQPAPNPEYDADGHLFAVTVAEPQAGAPLTIEVFDPAWVYVGDRCERQFTTPGGSGFSDAEPSTRCTGDQGFGGSRNGIATTVTTTYLVRAPDSTPDDQSDNPVVCASTYAGWPEGPDGGADESLPDGVIAADTFQAWTGLCEVPAADVRAGTYLVQVRTNADLSDGRWAEDGSLGGDPGSLTTADPNAAGAGMNRFALRAGWDGDIAPPDEADPSVSVQAVDRLTIYANGAESTAEFSLVRIPNSAAGRVLRLGFWDLGDVSSGGGTTRDPTTGKLLAPEMRVAIGTPADATSRQIPDGDTTGSTGTSPPRDPDAPPGSLTCDVSFEVREEAPTVDGCTIGGITSATFNATTLEVRVFVPADYRCDEGDDCWLPLRLEYPNGYPSDTTTWTAEWEMDESTGDTTTTTAVSPDGTTPDDTTPSDTTPETTSDTSLPTRPEDETDGTTPPVEPTDDPTRSTTPRSDRPSDGG